EEVQNNESSQDNTENSEPQVYVESLYVPESPDWTQSNDPFYSTSGSWGNAYDDLYWLKTVHADEAWSISKGTGVTVAVIDTGIDFNHPDLVNNVWYNDAELYGLPGVDDDGNGFVDDIRGWDFHNNDNNSIDDHGHGTHVAGIIAAAADNGIGIAGIAPESKIMSLKALNASGSGFIQSVISAIRYAANMGAKVINMSLGIMKNFLSKTLQKLFNNAVQYAVGKGAVVVAAAGNDGANIKNTYPAALSNVIAVGATEPVTNKRAYFSNFGSQLDFVAPGVDVLSLRAGGTSFGLNSTNFAYSRASGTSMASPIVAGVVALLRSWNPLLSLTDIYNRLKNSAVDLGSAGFDSYYGYGLVNAFAALTYGTSTSTSSSSSETTTNSGRSNGRGGYAASKAIRSLSFSPSGIFSSHASYSAFATGVGSIGNWYVIDALHSNSSGKKRSKNS
ncbi:MAG TPA: S8 family peptidase, partial [bacterium]|nr:S8 family peptidase [bacterium]